MTKSVLFAASGLFALLAVGPTNVSPLAALEEGEASCFACEDWKDQQDVYWHEDYQLFQNDKQGTLHANETRGSCLVHAAYSQS